MIDYLPLRDRQSAQSFRHMTFAAYYATLDFEPTSPPPLVVGARAGGLPAGLALARRRAGDVTAELLSVFVAPDRRGQGIAAALVRAVEAECAREQVPALTAKYMGGLATSAAVEHILAKGGWSQPCKRTTVLTFPLEKVRAQAGFERSSRPPRGFDILPWTRLAAAERTEIRVSNARLPWIEADLVPFDHEADLDTEVSVALRSGGAVVGWCIGHRSADAWRVSCAFVREDARRAGAMLPLVREALERASRAGYENGMVTAPVWHAWLHEFAHHWIAPLSTIVRETFGVYKLLIDDPALEQALALRTAHAYRPDPYRATTPAGVSTPMSFPATGIQ